MKKTLNRRVALVGRRISGNENLGLGYLCKALRNAGYEVSINYINRGEDVHRIARTIDDRSCFMVGISMNDGGSAFLPLALGEMLKRRGFTGHITAGGHFATLADEWLLDRYDWLDSVVRFAGEVPVVALAERVMNGGHLASLPAVRTRSGPGLPAPVLDATPLKLVPERDVRPELIGYGVAQICASRGCKGRCAYCGPAALQRRERAEGRAQGATARELSDCGVGGVKRRSIDDLCDEMAALWHQRRVRYFYVVDEHMLPYDEREALAYLDEWQAGLKRRKVGRFGIGLMLRAEKITPKVAARFKEVGLVRAFIGLELATAEEGRLFGRRIDPEGNLRIFDAFRRLQIETVSNLMLVHPYSTLETIAGGLRYLQRIGAGMFETTRMMPYHGTRLAERLEREGRLDGNPLRYGYAFDDPAVARFVQTYARLRARSFRDYSLAYYAHDVFVSMALARHLFPERSLGRLHGRIEDVRQLINRTYIEAYTTALSLAIRGETDREEALVNATTRRVRRLQAALAIIDTELSEVLSSEVRRFSPLAQAAAAVFAFSMAGTIPACYTTKGAEDGQEDASAMEDTGTGADGDADTDADGDTDADTDGDTGTDACDTDEGVVQEEEFLERMAQEASCFFGQLYLADNADGTVYPYNRVPMSICGEDDLAEASVEAQAVVDSSDLTCVPKPAQWIFYGDTQTDLDTLGSTVEQGCGINYNHRDFVVHLDEEGFVSGVEALIDDPAIQEAAACVAAALNGLQFPCLANFDVCPEYLIAE